MAVPRAPLDQHDTHRLIPVRKGFESVLERLTTDPDQLRDLIELDGATNDRLLGEANLLPGIGVHELLFGVSYAHIVNASFCHPHPRGGRFNGPERGAWYAAFDLDTSTVEVSHHKREELREINWQEPQTFTFDDYLADFHGEFHDLRRDKGRGVFLNPDSYTASQRLARELLADASPGIVYPSVRHRKGTCLACFRPALVTHVRKGKTLSLTISA